ncbi:MAG: Asp-tRNA(Asn)/Glu-tRNA(Gln) amidotransferase subunit GatC [Cytophagaceae bacterium]|jgi:aspartyl-tRNA(Asn)/glutamyl-tRNA(Gln) amidotransferase subunit C|nr:Asp-tRNA(Asn)/Glu-tRNA(Gln) amidotransferase subunit GatC [Cytophagaceae bacterium]
MSITAEEIKKIAYLARLEFTEEELKNFSGDFNKILVWMEKLNELDTTSVEPLIHMSHEINVLREDEVKITLTHQEALSNAPKKDTDYFRVPKFLS